jgi:hypothetical protein
MWINGQDMCREMAQGLTELSEHQLDSLSLGDTMGVEQMMHSRVTGHKGQTVSQFEALLTQGALVPFAGNAKSGFVDQLECHPGIYLTGLFAGPAAQQVPGTQAQVFWHQEPDTHQVAGDLVAQELPDLPFDAAAITGLKATRGFCSLRFNTWRRGRGKPKMEFFFGDRIR